MIVPILSLESNYGSQVLFQHQFSGVIDDGGGDGVSGKLGSLLGTALAHISYLSHGGDGGVGVGVGVVVVVVDGGGVVGSESGKLGSLLGTGSHLLSISTSTEETPARRILPQNLGAVGCKVILKRAICRCSKGEVGGQGGVEGWEGWEGRSRDKGLKK